VREIPVCFSESSKTFWMVRLSSASSSLAAIIPPNCPLF
jgi:hypothetical protein